MSFKGATSEHINSSGSVRYYSTEEENAHTLTHANNRSKSKLQWEQRELHVANGILVEKMIHIVT